MSTKNVSLLPVYLIGFSNFAAMTLLYPVMPPYAAGLGGSVAQVGLVVALQPYVAALTQAPVGLLSDRLGRRLLLLSGIGINIISYFLYLFTSNLGILMAVRAFNGLGNAGFYPAATALVVDIAPQEKRGEALGLFATGTQLGSMAGPALGGILLQNFGYRAPFLASAAIAIAGLLLALTTLKYASAGGAMAPAGKFTLDWLWGRGAIMSLLATLLVQVGVASVIAFLPLYGLEIGINVASVGLIIGTIYIGSVFTRFLAGKMSDRVGRMPVIIFGLSLCTVAAFLFSVLTKAMPLHLAALLFGLGLGSALPACAALIADVAPLRMRGMAMGMNSASFNAGLGLGSTGLGLLAGAAGFARMYLITSAILAAAAVGALVARPRHLEKKK
ncbi:MAG: MFS transporter [Chloroflexi bacterium]|nr:MFS transporter [Chloroflexota bacterium]